MWVNHVWVQLQLAAVVFRRKLQTHRLIFLTALCDIPMFVYFAIESDYSRVCEMSVRMCNGIRMSSCVDMNDAVSILRVRTNNLHVLIQVAYSIHSLGKIGLLASLGLLMDEWCSVLYMNEHLYPRPWYLSRTFLVCCVSAVRAPATL